jgi:formylglycine-generating enzyme required for sulfatase activity
MTGNVHEWIQDWYDSSQESRVLRGGSWSFGAQYARAANRSFGDPAFRHLNNGFRLARTLP